MEIICQKPGINISLKKKKKLCKNNLILKDQDKYIFPICDVFFSVLRL